MARRGKKNSKFLRLTGLWQSKRNDKLFSGKLRNQDIEGLIERLNKALDEDADMVFFLWENDQESRRDPVFTLQTAVAEENGGGRRSRRDRDDDDDHSARRSRSSRRSRDDEDDEDQEQEESDEQDEEPKRKSKNEDTGKGKGSSKRGKKDEDW